MKQLMSFLLLCAFHICYAQPPDSIVHIPNPYTFDISSTLLYTGKVPVHYYPFYNGVQFIEVDYYAHSLAEGRHLDMVQPRGGSWYDDALRFSRPNGYLLRNRDGKILKNYGVENVRKLDLQSPDKARTITHKCRLDAEKAQKPFMVYPGYWPSRRNGYAYIYRDEDMTFTLIDTFGVVRLEKYQNIAYMDSCYVVGNGEKCGLFSDQFQQLIPFKYLSIQLIEEDIFLAYDGKYTFINKNDKLLDQTHYANVYFPNRINGYFTYKLEDGKHGLMDRNLKRITPPEYTWIEALQGKGYWATDTSNRMAILNDQGQRITPFKYEQRKPQWREEGYWLVMERDYKVTRRYYLGLVDTNGREVLPAKYDAIDRFFNGYAVATVEGKKGLVDQDGNELTAFKYDDMRSLSLEFYTVRVGTKSGLINKTGEVIVPIAYQYVHCVGDSIALVTRTDHKKAFYDLAAGQELPYNYDGGGCFVKGRAQVVKGNKQGLIDKSGKEYTNFAYDIIFSFNEGQWLVRKDGKFGAIDQNGKIMIPVEYTDVRKLENGDVRFSNNRGVDILNKDRR